MYKVDVKLELLSVIDSLRNQLYETSQREGILSQSTLKVSQELDNYIMKYYLNEESN
jgi:hypothetical protein